MTLFSKFREETAFNISIPSNMFIFLGGFRDLGRQSGTLNVIFLNDYKYCRNWQYIRQRDQCFMAIYQEFQNLHKEITNFVDKTNNENSRNFKYDNSDFRTLSVSK